MVKYLLSVVFLMLITQSSKSQCNAQEYVRIFSEANMLRETGAFIESKNKYEAAKIYACNQKEKDAADKAVDKLFEQIEQLRRKADSTTLDAYANDLAYKSQIALKDGDRSTAFRLAEFAYLYSDRNNPRVIQAFIDAVYYNDCAFAKDKLPWRFNLKFHQLIYSFDFSPDGSSIATLGIADSAFSLQIYDINNQNFKFIENKTPFIFANFSDDNRLLAIDTFLRVWDVQRKQELYKLEASPIFCSPNKKLLISHSFKSDTTYIIDFLSGKKIFEIKGQIRENAISDNGKLVATQISDTILQVWDITEKKKVIPNINLNSFRDVFTLSPDGLLLAVGSGHRITLWDISTGKIFSEFGFNNTDQNIEDIVISKENKLIIYKLSNDNFKIWDIIRKNEALLFDDNAQSMINASFSYDGQWLAIASHESIKLWNLFSNKLVLTYKHNSSIGCHISFSQNNKYLVLLKDISDLNIFCLESKEEAFRLQDTNKINNAVFLDNDRLSGSVKNTVKIWQLQENMKGRTIQTCDKYVEELVFSLSKNRFATISGDNTAKVWDFDLNDIIFSLEGDMVGICLSPNGNKLAVGSPSDSTILFWDIDTGNQNNSIKNILKANGFGLKICYSPDGKQVALGNLIDVMDFGDKIRLVNLDNSYINLVVDSNTYVSDMCFSPNGKYLGVSECLSRGKVQIWDLSVKRIFRVFEDDLIGYRSINNIEFSPDSKKIAIASERTAKVLDIATGKTIINFEKYFPEVDQVFFSPDGSRLAIDSNGKIRIFELNPTSWWSRHGKERRIASLTDNELKHYNLDYILELRSENESILLQTQDLSQIVSFADLYTQKLEANNFPRKEDYETGKRLWQFCIDKEPNNAYFIYGLKRLEKEWKGQD